MRAPPPVGRLGRGPVEAAGGRQPPQQRRQLVEVEVGVVEDLHQPAGPAVGLGGGQHPLVVGVAGPGRAVERLVVGQADHPPGLDRPLLSQRREAVRVQVRVGDELGVVEALALGPEDVGGALPAEAVGVAVGRGAAGRRADGGLDRRALALPPARDPGQLGVQGDLLARAGGDQAGDGGAVAAPGPHPVGRRGRPVEVARAPVPGGRGAGGVVDGEHPPDLAQRLGAVEIVADAERPLDPLRPGHDPRPRHRGAAVHRVEQRHQHRLERERPRPDQVLGPLERLHRRLLAEEGEERERAGGERAAVDQRRPPLPRLVAVGPLGQDPRLARQLPALRVPGGRPPAPRLLGADRHVELVPVEAVDPFDRP